MTERLAQLLHAEADHLDVPAPNAGPALSQGRGLRRRHRLVTGAVAVTVLAVIGGGALGINAIGGDDGDGKIEPAAPFDSGAVFSIGNTVYLDDATDGGVHRRQGDQVAPLHVGRSAGPARQQQQQ